MYRCVGTRGIKDPLLSPSYYSLKNYRLTATTRSSETKDLDDNNDDFIISDGVKI